MSDDDDDDVTTVEDNDTYTSRPWLAQNSKSPICIDPAVVMITGYDSEVREFTQPIVKAGRAGGVRRGQAG